MRAERYILPVHPPLLVIASLGFSAYSDKFDHILRNRIDSILRVISVRRSVVMVGILALVIIPAYKSLQYQLSFSSEDTRTIAKKLINQNLSKGSAVALSPMGMNLSDRFLVLDLPFNPIQTERLAPFYDIRWYMDIDLFVLSDYDYTRYLKEPVRFRDILKFYNDLRREGKLVADIHPIANQNGPTIWMIKSPGRYLNTEFPDDLFHKLRQVQHNETVLSFLYNLSQVLYKKNRLVRCTQVLRFGLSIDSANI